MSSEAEIVWSLKKHLQSNGLGASGWPVIDISVDSDGSYRQSKYASELEPMIPMPICGFYPDLVCSYRHTAEEGIAAFEIKKKFIDWMKGITQARTYREGAHRSYLALPSEKNSRFQSLEKNAIESGVGIMLLENGTWLEIISPAEPRPIPSETKKITDAIRGVTLPSRLQLNHPLNYLAVAWVASQSKGLNIATSLKHYWDDLKSEGSRQHAINGARYLGLISQTQNLTPLGATVAEIMEALNFKKNSRINKRNRFVEENPGLSGIARIILMQQESTKILIKALLEYSKRVKINTEQLFWNAIKVNKPLAAGLFLSEPEKIENLIISSSMFSPSFVFQFKQVLWHAGILSTPIHRSAGKGANLYDSKSDLWQLDCRITDLDLLIGY